MHPFHCLIGAERCSHRQSNRSGNWLIYLPYIFVRSFLLGADERHFYCMYVNTFYFLRVMIDCWPKITLYNFIVLIGWSAVKHDGIHWNCYIENYQIQQFSVGRFLVACANNHDIKQVENILIWMIWRMGERTHEISSKKEVNEWQCKRTIG